LSTESHSHMKLPADHESMGTVVRTIHKLMLESAERILLACTLLCAAETAGNTATYYVAVGGRPNADGSKDRPWPSIAYALEKIGGGHTILVRTGIYRGPIEIPKECAGTKEQPTILRSEAKQRAVIIGAEYHAIVSADGCDHVIVDGFEVLGAREAGIKMNGDHNVIRNCWVHNNGAIGIAMHGKTGGVIENNLVEFNGCHPQFQHGVYADGRGLTIQGNIVRHNASYGMHLYPALRNSTVANNLVYGHARKPGIIVACPDGGGKNVVVNNTVAENNGGIEIWKGDGEAILNNIVVAKEDVFELDDQTRNLRIDYNLCSPRSKHQGAHGMTGDPGFLDTEHGLFWLKADSPALGRGTREQAPANDFWGRPLSTDRAPDLGAFPFVPSLVTDRALTFWRQQWAYHHTPEVGQDMPDPWLLADLSKRQ
jgi:parallel beta-helix repeat protein